MSDTAVAMPRENLPTSEGVYGFLFRSDYQPLDSFYNLYEETQGKVKQLQSLDFRLEVMSFIKVIIPSFDQWIKLQLEQGYLYDRRLEFLLDTLNFIEFGDRKMSVRNWEGLMDEFPRPNLEKSRQQCKETLKLNVSFLSTVDIIIKWCSQKRGFDDMLCTFAILARMNGRTEREPMNDSSMKHRVTY